MEKHIAMPLLRIPVINKTATRKCPNCSFTMFKHDWPMHSIGLLLYKEFCPNCGQKLDWQTFVNVGGTD